MGEEISLGWERITGKNSNEPKLGLKTVLIAKIGNAV